MFTNRIFNHVTALMLTTLLLVNTVAAGGLSTCHCSSIDLKILEQCCCQNEASHESSSCCSQKFGSDNESECCQSKKNSNSCRCGCQHDMPAPSFPSENTQSRVQIELTISSNTLTVVSHASKVGYKTSLLSLEAVSSTPSSVQLLCCTWLT